jgi:rod shape-determining protein MreB
VSNDLSGDVAIDLGTASTRLRERAGALVDEPSIAAIDADTGRLISFGREALQLGAGAAGRVRLVRPVRRGQLADLELAQALVATMLRRAGVSRRARVLICVHADATAIQRRALQRALEQAGARAVRFLELPLAVAIGEGERIEEPTGTMVVEIGAGTSDIAVLALGGMVTKAHLSRGGEDFELAVRNLLSSRHGLVVDQPTAREVIRMIGTVDADAPEARVEVLGRDRATGRASAAVLRRSDLRTTLLEQLRPILSAAMDCIADAPPDLANDLLGSGVVLAGGGSELDGCAAALAAATGLVVHPAADPRRSAVNGAARCLEGLTELPALELTSP